jgi:hypothetical protein
MSKLVARGAVGSGTQYFQFLHLCWEYQSASFESDEVSLQLGKGECGQLRGNHVEHTAFPHGYTHVLDDSIGPRVSDHLHVSKT